MSYAIYKGETNLKDLVTRLFQLPDKTAKTSKQAQEALLQANPQLHDLSKVSAGSVIAIPGDAPPLKPSERAPEAISRQVEVTLQSHASLVQVSQKLQDLNQVAAQASRNFLEILHSEQVQAIAQSSEAKEQLPSLLHAVQASSKSTQAVRAEDVVATFRPAFHPHGKL
jgi:vacuolar-type H+-ATPase subunit I/STV1